MEFKTTIYSRTVKRIDTENNMSERKMVVAHKINLYCNQLFLVLWFIESMVSQPQYQLRFRFLELTKTKWIQLNLKEKTQLSPTSHSGMT